MRLPGWEVRLSAVIEGARKQPYQLGVWDCFSFSCAAVEALTGADRWPEFAGRYRTKGQARRLIARYGSSFEAAFSWFFGSEAVPVAQARRGDIVKFVDDVDEAHLGVCAGAEVAVYGETGVVFVPRKACACAWRIG